MEKLEIEKFKAQGGLRTVRSGLPDDLFLVCASYEPRTVFVAESLAPEYRSKRGIIYVNREFLEGPGKDKTKSNLDRLNEKLLEHCDAVSLVTGSWLDPKTQLISLKDALMPIESEYPQEAIITLDTTTFNREALMIAAVLLWIRFTKSHIRAIYVSPKDHGKWLSRGFRDVRNIMGFAGIQRTSQPTILAVLSGFEPERTLKIIEEHEPTKVLLGIGYPPTAPKFFERNINEQKLILARQEVEKFSFPADNIEDCCKCLENVLKPYLGKCNVILAPMSTKLSTLAALLIALHHPEIQITYCIPGEYNTDEYSIGVENIFIDEIPLIQP
jgi:hypothetical protein